MKLFTSFKVKTPRPGCGIAPHKFKRGEKVRILERYIGSGVWEISVDLTTRCCLSGGGGSSPNGNGLGNELLMFDVGDGKNAACFWVEMYHRVPGGVVIHGQVSKKNFHGFAMKSRTYMKNTTRRRTFRALKLAR